MTESILNSATYELINAVLRTTSSIASDPFHFIQITRTLWLGRFAIRVDPRRAQLVRRKSIARDRNTFCQQFDGRSDTKQYGVHFIIPSIIKPHS